MRLLHHRIDQQLNNSLIFSTILNSSISFFHLISPPSHLGSLQEIHIVGPPRNPVIYVLHKRPGVDIKFCRKGNERSEDRDQYIASRSVHSPRTDGAYPPKDLWIIPLSVTKTHPHVFGRPASLGAGGRLH